MVTADEMDENVKILDIAHLLQKKLAIIPGAIDREGFPLLIFYDAPIDISLVDNKEFLKVIDYLSFIARNLWDSDTFTVILDRRSAKWESIKLLLLKLKGVSSFQIHKLLVMQPKGFFQKHFGNHRKELQQLIDDKIVFLEHQDSLFNHIDVRQLPEDLSGIFEFSHLEWVEHRTAIERFEITCKKTQSRLDQLKETFNRTESLSSIEEIEQIRDLHKKVVSDVDDDLHCSEEIAETLENIVKKPFGTKQAGPLTQFNFDYLMKWMTALKHMRTELESVWQLHDKYLTDSLLLCDFERSYGLVSKEILEMTADVEVDDKIGQSLCSAEKLMTELNLFKDKTKETYEGIKKLRDAGYALIDKEHFASNSIRLRCGEIKKLCDDFEDVIEERKSVIQTNIDVHVCIKQLDNWYHSGMELLASQPVEEFQNVDGAGKLLKEIEKFIESDQGLNMGKINKVKQMVKKLGNSDIDEMIDDALKRTEDLTERIEKRENSLKKLRKAAERPIQPVKAFIAPKPLSPIKKIESAVLQTTAATRHRRESSDIREMQKKDIDVVVTSKPLRKRMSFKRTISKRRPFSTPMAKGPLGSSLDYEEKDESLAKGTALVIQELVDTERDYVNDLECVIEGYYKAFDDDADNIPSHLRGKKNLIFGNIDGIYRFHKTVFLKELEACKKSPNSIGQIFVDKREEFQFYAIYCKNKPNSEALRAELERTTTFLKDCQLKLGHRLPLDSYLLKPVQRITKYQLLLNEIMKYTSKRNPAYVDLQDAIKAMKRILRNVNDVMHSTGLVGFPEDITEQGKLLYQDAFIVWNVHKNKLKQMTKLRGRHRQVFLYENCLVFTKKEPGEMDNSKDGYIYQFKNLMKMSGIGLTEKVKDNPCKFEVWLQGRDEVYVLQPSTIELKETWVAEIRRLLVQQLHSVKESAGNQPTIQRKSQLSYIDPQRRGSEPNITTLPLSASPVSTDKTIKRFSFSPLTSSLDPVPRLQVPDRPSIRRVSEHDLYKASDSSPTGVYLSPASTPNEDDFSDSASNWSESEFDDDYDDGGEAFSSLDQESIGSISINSDGKSEVSTSRVFTAMADYTSVEPSELSLSLGDSLELVQVGSDGWWFMKNTSTNAEGWTPSAYVEEQSRDSGLNLDGGFLE